MKFHKGDKVSIQATVTHPNDSDVDLVQIHPDGFPGGVSHLVSPDRLTLVKAVALEEPPVGAYFEGTSDWANRYVHLEDGWRVFGKFGSIGETNPYDKQSYPYNRFSEIWKEDFPDAVRAYWEARE